MPCVLDIHEDAIVHKATLSALGRLVVHLGAGDARTVENSPGVPADQGGRLPIYESSAVIGLVPFTCTGGDTKSTGRIGSAARAGAAEAWVGTAGSAAGRLY